jgi:uncharacterized Zn finger protein (UPF0148 family)
VNEARCPSCGALLFRSDAEHGRLEIVCRKCGRKHTVYLGGYKALPRLTAARPSRRVPASTPAGR